MRAKSAQQKCKDAGHRKASMSLKVYFQFAVFTTIMALVYIHMQTKIFELSYNGKDKEKLIHELNDSNGNLRHQILTLKSANHLGNQLLDRDNSLQFMDNVRVMTVQTQVRAMPHVQPKPKAVNPFWNLFSFLGAQQAQAGE
jgi:cell division protein FtsL